MSDFVLAFNRCLFLTLAHSIWVFALLAIVAWYVGRFWRRNVELNYMINVAALALGMVAIPVTFCLIGFGELSADNLESANNAASRTISGSQLMPLQKDDLALNLPSSATTRVNARIIFVWELLSPWISGLYFAGVALMFTRLSRAFRRTGRIKSCAKPISKNGLDDLLKSLAKTWSMKVVPGIALAEQIVVPKVIGLIRPTILLPASAMTGLSQDDLEMVLAHELAHVQRHDMWVSLVQRIAESVMFFNPAVWFISRRIGMLQEFCCDEKACESLEAKIGDSTEQPRTRYALALLRVVELAQESVNHPLSPKYDLAALAISGRSPSELRRRVARLFGEPLREPIRLSRGSFLFGAMALFLLIGPTVWQSRAESSTHVKVATAEDALPLLKADEIQNRSIRFSTERGDAKDDTDDAIKGIEIVLATELLDLTDSNKPLSPEPTLRGQIVDGAGNPLPNVKVVLYGGLATRFRGQETDTDENGNYQFSPLNTGAMTTSDDGIACRYVGVKFIHQDYVAADGVTWRDLTVPRSSAHEEVLNLEMVPRGKTFGVANDIQASAPEMRSGIRIEDGFGNNGSLMVSESKPNSGQTTLIASDAILTQWTRPTRQSHNETGFFRRDVRENIGHEIVPGQALLISSKPAHRLQNVFRRVGVRKRARVHRL